jgi:hypothetical protein
LFEDERNIDHSSCTGDPEAQDPFDLLSFPSSYDRSFEISKIGIPGSDTWDFEAVSLSDGQDNMSFDPSSRPSELLEPSPAPPVSPSPPPPPLPSSRELDHAIDMQEELVEMRDQALSRRAALRKKRREIRGLRQQAGDLEGRLLKLLQVHRLDPQGLKPDDLEQVLDEQRVTRDRLGVAEADYEQEEEQYEIFETRLGAFESDFYDQWVKVFQPDSTYPTGEPATYDSLPTPPATQTIRPSDGLDSSPRSQYFKISDQRAMLEEELANFKQERTEVLQIMEAREGRKLPPNAEDLEFLAQFEQQFAQKREKIRQLKTQESALRDQLLPQLQDPPRTRIRGNFQNQFRSATSRLGDTSDVLSETGKEFLANNMADTRLRVAEWVMDQILELPNLRLRYDLSMSIEGLRQSELSDRQWWKLFRKLCAKDSRTVSGSSLLTGSETTEKAYTASMP